jgi:hypothetical protein
MDTNEANAAWSQPEDFDPSLPAIGDHDFADFNSIDFNSFDFLNYDTNNDKIPNQIELNLLRDAIAQNEAQHAVQHRSQQSPNGGQNAEMFDINMQLGFEQQQQQQNQSFSMPPGQHSVQHHSMMPPTPNSVEMHSDRARYMHQLDAQSRAILEQHYQMQSETSVREKPRSQPLHMPR